MSNIQTKFASWEVVTLGAVCAFKGGSGFKESFQGRDSGEHPFIKVSDLNLPGNEKYVLHSNNWVSTAELKLLKASLQPIGATVFAKVGAALKLNRRRMLVRPTVIDNNMMAAIPEETHLDREYLYYFLLGEDLGRFCQESAVPSINQGHLESIQIPLPPIDEQRKIAEILRAWDEAIETAEAEHASLVRQLAGLVQSVALRIPKGKAPSGWVDRQIGELVYEAERRVEWDDDATYKLVSCARRSGGIFHREDKLGSEIAVKKMQEIRSGDFILSRMQVLHGGWAMVKPGHAGHHVSDMYMILEPRAEHLYMPYFDWISRTSWMRHLAYLSSYGVHIEKMTFVPNLFLKAKVRIPDSIIEQKRIVEVLDGFSQKVDISGVRLELLRAQKRGLMQKLLTGEVRVAA